MYNYNGYDNNWNYGNNKCSNVRGREIRRFIRGRRIKGNNNMKYNNVRKGDEDYKEFKNLIAIIITIRIIINNLNNEFYRSGNF
jgi:hypothetical protein